ncbi:hypothetical protein BD769DRAFT_1395190 [Suillus cothurnatus]|nr:hypothetical protein BD769DRAFT_1395190 [Suillus cothurnatus]
MYQNGNRLDQYISNYSKVQLHALPKLRIYSQAGQSYPHPGPLPLNSLTMTRSCAQRSSELLDAVLLGNPFESPHIQKWPGSDYTSSHTRIEILLSSKGKSFKVRWLFTAYALNAMSSTSSPTPQVSPAVQHPKYHQQSNTPMTESMTSGTDDDFLFPCTPNFKHSDGVQRVHTSAGARLPTPSQPATQRHSNNHSYHPYRRPPSFQESHIFDSLLGRADTDDSTMSSNLKADDMFLKHLDALGPQMFSLVVHLQEAVRERQHMCLFTTYWEVEENSRRGALLQFLYNDAERDFTMTEQESGRMLMAQTRIQMLSETLLLLARCCSFTIESQSQSESFSSLGPISRWFGKPQLGVASSQRHRGKAQVKDKTVTEVSITLVQSVKFKYKDAFHALSPLILKTAKSLITRSDGNLSVRQIPRSNTNAQLAHPLLLTRKTLAFKPLLASNALDESGPGSAGNQSTRDHGMVTIKIVGGYQGDQDDPSSMQISRLTLVDLVGSERTKHTQATGDRLKEAGSINKSSS